MSDRLWAVDLYRRSHQAPGTQLVNNSIQTMQAEQYSIGTTCIDTAEEALAQALRQNTSTVDSSSSASTPVDEIILHYLNSLTAPTFDETSKLSEAEMTEIDARGIRDLIGSIPSEAKKYPRSEGLLQRLLPRQR